MSSGLQNKMPLFETEIHRLYFMRLRWDSDNVSEGEVGSMDNYLSHFNLDREPFPEIGEETADDNLLTERESGAYIRRSLRKAGMKDQVFYAGAIRRIYSHSLGDPKLINKICDFALKRAFYLNEHIVYEEMLADCLELLLESKPPDNFPNDKRKYLRVKTDFPGAFVIQGAKTRGLLKITNVSRAGVQLKLARQRLLKVKERVIVDFTLNDDNKSKVRTIVVVRNTFGFFAGCQFLNMRSEAYNDYVDTVLKRE